MKRRDFVKDGVVSALAAGALSQKLQSKGFAMQKSSASPLQLASDGFWPDGAQMVISISMQMEPGAQPSGAESPMPKLDPKYPDLATTKWYEYGFKEGPPRLLDMFDRRKVKVTSRMVGATADLHPALAKEIVQRGHEASGHGQTWAAQFRHKAVGLQCVLASWHTAHVGDSVGARLPLSH
jgi:peptidoglycan/xylan/chitin deacetylase (PgdA/CDA1 family)